MSTVRVLSYNIRKAKGTDGVRSAERILSVIEAVEPDIVLLQEADHRLGARPAALPHHLIEAHPHFHAVPLAANNVSLGWHGNAALVRDTVEVAGWHRLDLPGLEPRGAIEVDLDTAAGRISVIGTHLALLRPWRTRQVHALIDRIGDGAARSVVAGDFNEWAALGALGPLSATHRMIAPGRSFPARRPMGTLDRFGVGRGLSVRAQGVAATDKSRVASDHLPVWIDVEPA